VLNSNCLLETHLTQRNWAGSFLKSDQLVEIGVRNKLRPQAVFDDQPVPDLLRCVTLILNLLSVVDVANHIEVNQAVNSYLTNPPQSTQLLNHKRLDQ